MVQVIGLSLIDTRQSTTMIEVLIPAVVAAITGGGVLISRIHSRIHDLDRRVDGVELRMAEEYVNKSDFNSSVLRMEQHLVRIEDKLDAFIRK